MKQKISLFCNLPADRVISALDLKHTIYEVPLLYRKEKLDVQILKHFDLKGESQMLDEEWNPLLQKWSKVVETMKKPGRNIKIAIVGKYMTVSDAYRSVYEALQHGGVANDTKIDFIKIDPDETESQAMEQSLSESHGVLVPGGFGERGVRGKMHAIRYSRENKIPFLGICLGMQCAVIEFAQNVLQLKDANSIEFDESCSHPVITIMEEQIAVTEKGGTMRLGSYPCKIKKDTLLEEVYQSSETSERHRHRFEFNHHYKQTFEDAGMKISGSSPDGFLAEAVELSQKLHPWFIATQFHPEFASSPLKPHKLFVHFIASALLYSNIR